MNDFSEVLLYALAWCGSTNWYFTLFGRDWAIPILDIMLAPVFAAFGIYAIKQILSTVKD